MFKPHTQGLPKDIADQIEKIDAARVSAGLVLLISKDGEFISRFACRDEEQKAFRIRQCELMGNEWVTQTVEMS